MILAQRQPRIEDAGWLAIVRRMPCLICGRPGSDPAHLRSAARQYGKRQCGMAEKPDDRWVLPLCRMHHDDQHRHNEMQWWARHGIPDPHAVAIALYATRPQTTRPRPRRSPKAKPRKPREQRTKITTRKTEWPKREMQSRPMRTKERST